MVWKGFPAFPAVILSHSLPAGRVCFLDSLGLEAKQASLKLVNVLIFFSPAHMLVNSPFTELSPVCVLSSFSHVQHFSTPWTVAHQAPLSMGFPMHQAKVNPKAPPTSLEASSSLEQTGHPDTLAPRSCPPRALGQSGSLWRQRPCGGPPAPALDSLEVGLLFWVAPSTSARAACNPGPFLPPHSWAPRSSIPAPPPAGRQPPLQASPLI